MTPKVVRFPIPLQFNLFPPEPGSPATLRSKEGSPPAVSHLPANGRQTARQRAPAPSYYSSISSNPLSNISERRAISDELIPVVETATSTSRRIRTTQWRRFLRGPISMELLRAAQCAPGSDRTLAVYVLLKHRSDLRRATSATLPIDICKTWGISRSARARALAALQSAGLIRVKRKKGRTAIVELIPYPHGKVYDT
jgi:hypothetical protein